MNKTLLLSIAFMATALVAMERSPAMQNLEQLRDEYKREKQHQKDLEEVRRTVAMVEEREKKRQRAFNVMKIITQKLEDHHGE